MKQYRPVIVCDHPHPYYECPKKSPARTVIDNPVPDFDEAMDLGWNTQEYLYGYGDRNHYVTTQNRIVHDWEDEE